MIMLMEVLWEAKLIDKVILLEKVILIDKAKMLA